MPRKNRKARKYWFPFNFRDWQSDPTIGSWCGERRGIYLDCLFLMYALEGPIPDHRSRVGIMIRIPDRRMKRHWSAIRNHLYLDSSGGLYHPTAQEGAIACGMEWKGDLPPKGGRDMGTGGVFGPRVESDLDPKTDSTSTTNSVSRKKKAGKPSVRRKQKGPNMAVNMTVNMDPKAVAKGAALRSQNGTTSGSNLDPKAVAKKASKKRKRATEGIANADSPGKQGELRGAERVESCPDFSLSGGPAEDTKRAYARIKDTDTDRDTDPEAPVPSGPPPPSSGPKARPRQRVRKTSPEDLEAFHKLSPEENPPAAVWTFLSRVWQDAGRSELSRMNARNAKTAVTLAEQAQGNPDELRRRATNMFVDDFHCKNATPAFLSQHWDRFDVDPSKARELAEKLKAKKERERPRKYDW